MLETILIIAVVLASAFFVGRSLLRSFRKESGCRCDSGECSYAGKDCNRNNSRERSEAQ